MIISPPFLPAVLANATTPDPVMDAVDKFAAFHGVYPIAFDRRWHTGLHLVPDDQYMPVRAIADGEVVAFRVCQKPITDGFDNLTSNAGFVLLKHTTETGENRRLTFYSLYMHLLDLDAMNQLGIFHPADDLGKQTPHALPLWLQCPTGEAISGGDKKLYRKDIIGYVGKCQSTQQLHFEIFMTQLDFKAYFECTQLGRLNVATPTGADCWGHSYYVIPVGQTFRSLPPGADAHSNKLNNIEFDPLKSGQNDHPLHVEAYFHKGTKYTNVWSVAANGARTLLTESPIEEAGYEYDLYKRAKALYPTCPNDGYELLRSGRVLSTQTTLAAMPESSQPLSQELAGPVLPKPRATWVRLAFAAGKEGYIDISDDTIQKLSDADFPFFMGWQRISEPGVSPANAGTGKPVAATSPSGTSQLSPPTDHDGLWDLDKLKKMVQDSIGELKQIMADGSGNKTPVTKKTTEVQQKNKALKSFVNDPDNQIVRDLLQGFICQASSEWDGTNLDSRYKQLLDAGEHFEGKQDAYNKFIAFVRKLQFWDKTGLPAGEKVWFFHPLAFIRHFRKCGWLSTSELARCLPRSSASVNLSWTSAHKRALTHQRFLSHVNIKYLNSSPVRLLHFLAQTYIETGGLRTLTEDSLGHGYVYGPFYGRGYLQLTWPKNYEAYKEYRHILDHGFSPYTDPRITSTSTHLWAYGADAKRWAPHYDPEIIAKDLVHAAESSGMYWLAKTFRKTYNINRAADLGTSPAVVGFISWLINGGGNGYVDRQQFATLLGHVLLDTVSYVSNEILRYPPLAPSGNPTLCRTFPPTTIPFSQRVTINYVPQIP